MKKLIKQNQLGFSLPQAIISLGITAVIALAVMRLSQNATKVSKTAELRDEIRAEMAVVSRNLSSRAACTGLFEDQPLPVPTQGQPAPAPLYEYNGTTPQTIEINDLDEDGNPIQIGEFVVGGARFKGKYLLQSIGIQGDANNPTLMKIVFQYNRILENNEFNKALSFRSVALAKVSLNSTTGNIENCYALSTQGLSSIGETESFISLDEALSSICAGPGAIEQNGVCVTFMVSAMGCPTNQPYLKGYAIGNQTGDVDLYEPICSSMPFSIQHWWNNRDTYRCDKNQVQTGINYMGRAYCKDIPECNSLQILKMNNQGEFQCEEIIIDDQKVVFNTGDKCGLTSNNGAIGFTCGDCTANPTCNSIAANTCFGTLAGDNNCGDNCGMGSQNCCASGGSENHSGQPCNSDTDCEKANSCYLNPGTCMVASPPGLGYDDMCEPMGMNQGACVAQSRCDYDPIHGCGPKAIPCNQLDFNSCTYEPAPPHGGGPSTCVWQPPSPQKTCHC
ncbi:hypothetical protein N9N67_05190 [Bacteriovoracaceae bacterium]|nr:hypothetical protein [Bacteriovoracaceae bacterium]